MDDRAIKELVDFLDSSPSKPNWPSHIRSKNQKRSFRRKREQYKLRGDTLFTADGRKVPSKQEAVVMDAAHVRDGRHWGVNETFNFATRSHFWPNATADVRRLVALCDECSPRRAKRDTAEVSQKSTGDSDEDSGYESWCSICREKKRRRETYDKRLRLRGSE